MNLDGSFFESLVHNMSCGVFLVGLDKRIEYWNNAAETLTGYSKEEVIGQRSCKNFLKPIDEEGNSICEDACPGDAVLADGLSHNADVFLLCKDGRRLPVTINSSPFRDDQGSIIGTVQLIRDNSMLAAAQERIEELETLSLIDPLTKLGNRLYVEMNLLARLHELRRYGWPLGVLFMDIDGFKEINDTYGHDMGDKMLIAVSGALQSQSRPFDVLGRWGGDEFCAVVVHASYEQLGPIAERYRAVVEETSVRNESAVMQTTISIGATLAKPDDSVDALYRRADQLMYKGKNAGGNRVALDDGDQKREDSDTIFSIEVEKKFSLPSDSFSDFSLYIEFLHRKNKSNDEYYRYSTNIFSVGTRLAF